MAKLNETQVRLIREMYATGSYTQTQIASVFNVHHSMISLIVIGKNWKHV